MRSIPKTEATAGGTRARPARRRLLVGVLGLAIAAASPGCGRSLGPPHLEAGRSGPLYGGTLRTADTDDFRSLDPAIAYDAVSAVGVHLCFNGLLGYAADSTALVPDLAETLPAVSADGRTYTLHLRAGLRFHNGRAVVSDDLRYSIERVLNPRTSSPGVQFYTGIAGADDFRAGRAAHVRGIETPDPRTIRFHLAQPDATFPDLLALGFAVAVPREAVERWGKEFSRHPVGTGPFRFVEWQYGDRAVFERNPHYHREGLPYLDRVVVYFKVQPNLMFLRMAHAELDQFERPATDDYLYVLGSPRWQQCLYRQQGIAVYGELLNTEMPPFDSKLVRQAMNYAVNKERIIKVRNRRATIAAGVVPPLIAGYQPNLQGYPYDPAKARALLERAGYPHGFKVKYLALTTEDASAVAQSVQADLKQVGIDLTISQVTFPVYLDMTQTRKTVPMAYSAWSIDYPDISDFLEPLFHSNRIAEKDCTNGAFYHNPAVDALLDAGRVERDPARRIALYQEAERLIVDDAPWIFEYFPIEVQLALPHVKDYRIHPIWLRDYERVWLDLPAGRARP